MDIDRKSWIALVTGIFLIIAALLSGEILAGELERLNGEVGLDKIIVSPLYGIKDQGQDRLEIETLEKLKEKMSAYLISYSTYQETVAQFEGRSMSVCVDAVDASLTKFKSLNFVKGGYWSADTDIEQGMVGVIDSEAAVRLFGSTDVVGKMLKLEDKEYRIIGVMQEKTSLINKLFYDGRCHIYIPISSFMEDNKEAEIREVQITDSKEVRMDRNEIEAALGFIGESPEKYSMMDFRKKSQQLRQKSQLIIFFIGLLIEVMLFKLGKKIVFKALLLMKKECKTDYLQNVVKRRYRELLGTLVTIFAILCTAVFIILTIRFDLYIPVDLIPDELIDLAFFGRLIENELQGGMASVEQYRTLTHIQFSRVNKLQDFVFVVLVPLGFVLMHYGYANIKLNWGNIAKIISLLSAVLASEVFIWMLLSRLGGFSMFLNFHSLIIVWGFIFLKMIMVCLKEDFKC